MPRHQIGEQDLVSHLIEYAHEAEQQQRHRIRQHPAGESPVKPVADAPDFGDEPQRHRRRADEVGKEYQPHAAVESPVDVRQAVHPWHHQEDEEVERDIGKDECHLEAHKLDRATLLPQAGEHDGLERVQPRNQGETGDILRMVAIAHRPGYRPEERHHQRDKHQRDSSDHAEGVAVHHSPVLTALARETEECRLHPERQQREQQGRIGIEVGDYAVPAALGGNLVGVQRDKQIVEKSPDYAAYPVYRGVTCQ